ncbi:unnamed protein product [Microthlaspi erraticum]|uniref:Uncharacterized protein n=1 Tax=Microthlaspi erraticum TaxID=1685480 RepID=A0A6D2J540_9BRAS|nr:unnamed protein product [Microthlaspi erraticum]
MVASADSQVMIISRRNLVHKYRGSSPPGKGSLYLRPLWLEQAWVCLQHQRRYNSPEPLPGGGDSTRLSWWRKGASNYGQMRELHEIWWGSRIRIVSLIDNLISEKSRRYGGICCIEIGVWVDLI